MPPAHRYSYGIVKAKPDGLEIASALAISNPSGLAFTIPYEYRWAGGILSTGVISYAPGQTLAWADPPTGDLSGKDVVQFVLLSDSVPQLVTAYYLNLPPPAPTPPPVTLVARGSAWKYPNVAGQLPTSWKTTAYSDSAWQSGATELGFGDGDEVPPQLTRFSGQITYYFRKVVPVVDPSAFSDLSLWMRRDDGAVMYFNGQEVHRSSSMPPLPTVIGFTTEATNEGENAEQSATLGSAAVSALAPGDNLLAVEIHQDDAGSTDISFNLELIGNRVLPPPVYVFRYGPQLLVAWTQPAFGLEQADSITGPWGGVVTGGSPYVFTLNPSIAQKFFRLKR